MSSFLSMLWKELIEVSNRRRFLVEKILLSSGMALIFVFATYSEIYSANRTSTYQSMARFGREFFFVAAACLGIVLPVASLIYGAGIVAAEHARRRLPLLLVTPLGSLAIVGSKAVSVAMRTSCGALAIVPFIALLEIFGGVDSSMLLYVSVLVASNVWLYLWVGVASSVFCRGIVSAVSLAFGLTVAWNLIVFPIVFFQWAFFGGLPKSPPGYLFISPVYTYALFAMSRFSFGDMMAHVVVNLGLGAVFMTLALVAFRPLALRRVSGAARTPWRLRLPFFRRRKAAKPKRKRSFLGAGVLAKELSARRIWRMLLPVIIFAAMWICAFCALLVDGGSVDWLFDSDFQQGMFLAESVVLFFLLSVYASVSVSAEKESLTLIPLTLTTLSAFRILASKALALLIEQLPALVLLFVHMLLTLGIDLKSFAQPFFAVVGFWTSCVFSVTLGIYFSLAARKNVSALVTTALGWFTAFYVIVVPVLLLGQLLGIGWDSQPYLWAGLSPVGVTLLIIYLRLSARRGLGEIPALLSFGIVCSLLFLAVTVPMAAYSHDDLSVLMSLLPVAGLAPWDWHVKTLPIGLYLLPVQFGALAWMIGVCLLSFRAQVRRAV